MAVPKVAAIHDLSGLGKCSLTAAVPVLSAMGVQACPLPTAVLSNQTGFPSYACVDLSRHLDAFTREQMQTLLLKLWHETGKQVLLITHDIEEAVFMATELVLLSPGPGRVLERLPLNFARRFVAGEPSRSIKSDPQFIAMREYVLGRVFEQREAFS